MNKKCVVAVICEFNPFHNGHEYFIHKVKEMFSDAYIIAVMSGNFTQRAEPSIISKRAKTECALKLGVDLVLEIPVIWSIASAQYFAKAATFLADALGIVDYLVFGSESGNIIELQTIANCVYSNEIQSVIRGFLNKGNSYPSARYQAAKLMCGEKTASVLNFSNNILGIEYINAINSSNSNIRIASIKRRTANGSSLLPDDNFVSASFIRESLLTEDLDKIKSFIPNVSYNILHREIQQKKAFIDPSLFERLIFFKLRTSKPYQIKNIIDVNEGLEQRICDKVRYACSLKDLYDKIKTKRYTYSRVKRVILACLLGISKPLLDLKPKYINILGFTKRGQILLRLSRKKSALPVITRPKDILKLGIIAKRIFDIERRATDIYNLITYEINPANLEITTCPIII